MIGQNVLMELQEGDKVQVYLYTSSGITDHKNSHYTQFIGILLRPSVETLGAAMRRLGNAELDEDVSITDDFSLRSSRINGEATATANGGRSKRSKSRVLSPPPAGTTNNAADQNSRKSVERLLSPPPQTNNHSLQNGGSNSKVIPEEPEEDLTSQPEPGKKGTTTTNNADPDTKPQSYLALTKLGMGKKKSDEESTADKKFSPKEGKKSQNGSIGSGSKKSKSMAEMASSTLKGFAKM